MIRISEARVVVLITRRLFQFGIVRQISMMRAKMGDRHGLRRDAIFPDDQALVVQVAVEHVVGLRKLPMSTLLLPVEVWFLA